MTTVTGQTITYVRELQPPFVGVVLLSACTMKLARAVRARSVSAGLLGPTQFFPRPLRRPATMVVWGAELFLGAALILTAGQPGMRADAIRLATGLFFVIATCALVELRERRPGAGCGCFGDFSTRPVGVRSIARAVLLTAAAVAGTAVPALGAPRPVTGDIAALGIVLAELLLVLALSPEVAEILVRLGYSEPCEVRQVPPQRALTALRRSRAWRRHTRAITSDAPGDMWRELCWWYAVYPARDGDRDCHVVFAVQVKPRWPAVHAVVVGQAGPQQSTVVDPAADAGSPSVPSASF